MLLHEIIDHHARSEPDARALITDEVTLSFSQLSERIRRLAAGLGELAGRGDRVAILSGNRAEYVECYYGVPRAGMTLCFLNYRLSPVEIGKIINDAEARVIVTEPEFVEVIRSLLPDLPSVEAVVVAGGDPGPGEIAYEDLLAAPANIPSLDDHVDIEDTDIAWLIYTSGTTGMPKGAMLSHRNLLASVNTSLIAWERGGKSMLFPWPLCHVSGYAIPTNHLAGSSVVVLRQYDPEAFLRAIERHRCTSTSMAPTMLTTLMDHPAFATSDLTSLQRIGYGASAMPASTIRRAMNLLPGVGFSTGFGMTELSGNVCSLDSAAHLEALDGRPELLSSVGRPMPLAAVRVVTDEMTDVAVGEVGEIVVRGDQVLTGYWRRPEATEEAFFGGWFHTGDLARWDAEGNLYIVDRKKDMIISGGENVYSREVEDVLHRHAGVAEAAVIGLPDPLWGETVVAVVLPVDSVAPPTFDELVALCRANLAGYKKPRQIFYIDQLPRNAAGKILKRELRERYAQPAPINTINRPDPDIESDAT